MVEVGMTDATRTIQVFILAENRLLREALARILKKNDARVVGESAFIPTIVEQIYSANPTVLLSDSAALALSELHLVQEVLRLLPDLNVVMIGMENDADIFLRAIRDGVVGYVLKDASALEVAAAVRSAA